MRAVIILLLVISWSSGFSQLKFPKGFMLVKGENGMGMDDEYSNGRYTFDKHQLFVENAYKYNDDSTKNALSSFWGFPFHFTKDSLCWGSGLKGGFYSYLVIAANGENFEFYSAYNDKGFSFYSKWLLSTIRRYKKKHKEIYFPWRLK